MVERLQSKKKKKFFLLLLLGAFALSVSLGAVFANVFSLSLNPEDIISHFSQSYGESFCDCLKLLASSFYDDCFDILYLFALSFTAFGKPISIGIISLRGARLGYYFISLANTFCLFRNVFSPIEYILWVIISIAINLFIILFSREAFIFNDETKAFYPKRYKIIVTSYFVCFVTDTLLVCGAVALSKIIYTLCIIAI